MGECVKKGKRTSSTWPETYIGGRGDMTDEVAVMKQVYAKDVRRHGTAVRVIHMPARSQFVHVAIVAIRGNGGGATILDSG